MGEFDSSRRSFLLGLGAAPLAAAWAQEGDPARRAWSARWIRVPEAPPKEYGVYHFRRTFQLAAKPQRFVVHASADNRYQLFVNGRRVGADGSSALFDLLLLTGYGWAAEMEAALGRAALAGFYRGRAQQLRQTVQQLYWTGEMYADRPEYQQFSQHTNTMAVLADVITGDAARDLMRQITNAPSLAVPGLFFQFYVHQALAKVGEGDTYLDRLGRWREMLEKGLTTFAEVVDLPGSPSRSDCHAWSASPTSKSFWRLG